MMNPTRFGILVFLLTAFSWAQSFGAELSLNRYLSDQMVLQRGKPNLISGSAEKGAQISIVFAEQKKQTTADEDGRWRVQLNPMAGSSEPRNLLVSSGEQKVTIKGIVIGDVILHARQTSVDISLGRTDSGLKRAQQHHANSNFRAISIKTIPSMEAQSDLLPEATPGWSIVKSASAKEMTGSAYLMGHELAQESEVPLGIVDLNLGYAFPVSWLSREELEQTEKLYGRTDIPGQLIRFDKVAAKVAAGETVTPGGKSSLDSDFLDYALCPAGGYNGSIAPLKGLSFKAVILQLGNDYPYMIYEDGLKGDDPFDRKKLNLAYVQTYDIRKVGFRMERVTLPRVPREWRKAFGDEQLPIGLVLPPSSDLNTMGQHHREMRELQRLMAEDNPNMGVILPGMEYTRFSGQPADDKLLAERSLSWLRADVYEQKGQTSTGPLFDRAEFSFNSATVHFKEGTAHGLRSEEKSLDYFEVAGVLGDYSPATATIDGDTIKIKSDTVRRVTRVRYNWNSDPDQGLMNSAGLPAIPFRSEKADYHWFVTNSDDDLPMEYQTPANEWPQNDVTLVNGQLKIKGYFNFTGRLGPTGINSGPFGPNMGVRGVAEGTPADGKVFIGDVIYSANGRMLGEKAWEVMASAITESEGHDLGGKLVLGIRRNGKNVEVPLKLEVLGDYSPRAPYDCPKTEKILSNLEKWTIKNGAKRGFLNYDAIFMLATGNPELQGYVRRIVYDILERRDISVEVTSKNGGKSWHNSGEAFLLGEYYMATGDTNVLGHLKHACDRLAATQHEEGGWRHNFPGGAHYGLIPNAGIPGVLGMHFAREAGVDINLSAYEKGVSHFAKNRTETGFLIYGIGPLCEKEEPPSFDPAVMAAGGISNCNGGLAAAAILMKLTKRYRAANLASFMCTYSWNTGFDAHGGDFWGNFWSPLGAYLHGEEAFIHYWKNRRWIRELNRMHDGSLIQNQDAGTGAACGIALVAHRKQIQVTGAPLSPFSLNAPEALGPAVVAFKSKNYGLCQELVAELLLSGSVGREEKGTVEYLGEQARMMELSIDSDFKRIDVLAEAGEGKEAMSFLPGLKAVLVDNDPRLKGLEDRLKGISPVSTKKEDVEKKVTEEKKRDWIRLVSETLPKNGQHKGPVVVAGPEKANTWKMKIVEDLSQAPEGWVGQNFEDELWPQTQLPVSWRMYHTALLRTKFKIEDVSKIDSLRLYSWVFRQQGIEIYLNGNIIGKINNLEKKTGDIESDFLASALKHLRNGENTLAITTRHNWRWGMLFMKVYNDGFDFNLDARLKLTASE